MKWTQCLIPTLKEKPTDAEVISHILMVRAGYIRRLTAGSYSYLPLGKRLLAKIEKIIREEMDNKGAQEVLLPALQPKDIWEKTGRYSLLGEVLIRFQDRHSKENILGPTHEEVITSLVAGELRSYKQLPLILYQIQTKFRDEPRPRFGILRSKEFIMKDAYSFDIDVEGLNRSYRKMYDAYCNIFSRCGLDYVVVEAVTGFMGGDVSHEFIVPAENGEDIIVICKGCNYSASKEAAQVRRDERLKTHSPSSKSTDNKVIKEVYTPSTTSIDNVSSLLNQPPKNLLKTIIYKADDRPIAVLIRGDFEVNEAKVSRYLGCERLEMADEETISSVTGGPLGYSGPVGLKGVRILADYSVEGMQNFVTGANKKDYHLMNVNLGRDFEVKEWADLRYITPDDRCPKCNSEVWFQNAIEVGHTFKLGIKYSTALGAEFLDVDGKKRPAVMGCYGIGINRIAAACIEQNNDENGIIWPTHIAPFKVIIIPIHISNKDVKDKGMSLYQDLIDAGVDVLIDDRDERAGIKFKDADLIGIPFQVIISEKHLPHNKFEIKIRKTGQRFIGDKGDLNFYLTRN